MLGSYPPVPGEPAAATVAAVRRAWTAGAEVVVASPRPSAAPVVLLRHGPALAGELSRLRDRHRCDQVVLCLEPGWPLVPGVDRVRAAAAIARAMRRAARTELVVTGSPSQWGPVLDELSPLWTAVDMVTVSEEALAPLLRPRTGAVQVREVKVPSALFAMGALGVGPLEPGELLLSTRGRRALGRAARSVLGRREPQVRSWLKRAARPLLRLAER